MHQGAKMVVLNCYGIWFKIQHHKHIWVAVHPVHVSLNLQGNTLEGINITELIIAVFKRVDYCGNSQKNVHQNDLIYLS
jgi:hypothetical protein